MRANKCQKFLQENFKTDQITDGELKAKYESSEACAIVAISRSIPPEVASVLPPDILDESISELLRVLDVKFINKSPAHHKILKLKAENLIFGDDITMKTFIQLHLKIRNQMISSQYPLISDLSTTMEFITQGLASHPMYEGVHDHFLLQGYPNDIKELSDNLQKLEASRKQKQEKPMQTSNPPQHHNRPYNNNRGRGRFRTRNRWQNRQPHRASNQEPAFTMNQFTTLLNALQQPPTQKKSTRNNKQTV